MTTSEDPLADLRWHWGSAYAISHPEPDRWIAQRRDDNETLRADDPEKLLARIRIDYRDHSVPRQRGK